MTQLDTARVVLPAPPPCAPWCPGHDPADQHHPSSGWDLVDPSGVFKVCRRKLLATKPIEVEVQAWSSLRWPDELQDAPPGQPRRGPRWYPTEALTIAPFDLISTRVEVLAEDLDDSGQVEQLGRALIEAAALMRTSGRQLDRLRTLTLGSDPDNVGGVRE